MITIPVSVTRRRKDGTVVPFKIMQLTRVPSVGDHVACVASARDDANDEPVYRVTGVVHFALDRGRGSDGGVAEVWAVEISGEPGFGAREEEVRRG